MLDLLRRKAQSPYLQATVLIIIVVFVFWGVGNNTGGSRNAVATVNGEPITLEQYDKALGAALDNYRNQFGGTLPKGFVESFGVKKQVLNDLIQKQLLQQGGQEMGIYVGDAEIQNAVKEMTVFQNNGQFDVDRYHEVLKASRLTPTKFEDGLRNDLLMGKIATQLAGFGRVTSHEAEERFLYENAEIRLEYASFNPEDYAGQVQITPEALNAYYEKNKANYKTALQIKLSYLAFRNSEVMKNITVSDDEVKEYYTTHESEFSIPEKRRASHILLQTTEQNKEARRLEIDKILTRAKSGEDFAALARQFSEDGSASQGGDLGFFTRGQMVKPFEDAAFTLAKGAISDVLTTQFGYHIIQLTDVQPAVVTPLDAAKNGILQKMTQQKAANIVFEKANEAYEKIIFAGSLAKYAENFSVTPDETVFFSQDSPPPALAEAPAVIATAFTLKKGELSSLLETPDGFIILLVSDTKEPVVPELNLVKERVEKDFITQEANNLSRKAAEEALVAVMEKGVSFAEKIKEKGGAVKESEYFSRSRQSAGDLPAAVIEAGLRLTEKKPYPENIVEAENAFYVCRFKDKKEVSQESLQARQSFDSMLKTEKEKTIMEAWTTALMKSGKITVNEQYLN
ncbi:MAG: SurA N-terminal domain-containing protein [Pseudomonadota bacterium]